jgi:integrase
MQDVELPGKHMLRLTQPVTATLAQSGSLNAHSAPVKLSEAVAIYLRLKGDGKGVTFRRAAERSCGYVLDVCGDKPLTNYTKSDANAFRDALIARGMAGSSITRVFGSVRSVINFAASEEGLNLVNPFGGVYYDRSAGVGDRQPIPTGDIRTVQAECSKIDDEMRWLVALVADTGMRLAEAAGLLIDDIMEDEDGLPFVRVRPHPWRRLKTKGSERDIPLVGSALWATQRLQKNGSDGNFAFPRYNKTTTTNANSASAGLNRWLKTYVPDHCTMHSFRHSMRDRLRAVECPSDIVDQIGGWQSDGVGQGYGKGYPLSILARWIQEVTKDDC